MQLQEKRTVLIPWLGQHMLVSWNQGLSDMKSSSPTFSGQYPSTEQGHWTTGCLEPLLPYLP